MIQTNRTSPTVNDVDMPSSESRKFPGGHPSIIISFDTKLSRREIANRVIVELPPEHVTRQRYITLIFEDLQYVTSASQSVL